MTHGVAVHPERALPARSSEAVVPPPPRVLPASIAVALVAVLANLRFLGLPYSADDHWLIGTLYDVDFRTFLATAFQSSDPAAPGDFFRPLWRGSFWVDGNLFGADPRWSHAVSLALHGAAVGALHALVRSSGRGAWLSLWIAGLFAIYPSHLEAVAWVAARGDSLALLFGSLAAIGLLGEVRRPRLGFVALLLAFMSKEPALAFGPAIAMGLLWQARSRVAERSALRRYAGLALFATGLWIALRAVIIGVVVGAYESRREVPMPAMDTLERRIETLQTLIAPWPNLSVGAETLASLLLLGFVALAFVRSRDSFGWLGVFAATLVAGTVALWHGIVSPSPMEPDSRFIYLGAAGWCVLLGIAFNVWLRAWPKWRTGFAVSALLVTLFIHARLTIAYRAAGERIREYHSALVAEVAREGQSPLVLIDIPLQVGPLLSGAFSVPFAVMPPFTDVQLRRPIAGNVRVPRAVGRGLDLGCVALLMLGSTETRAWRQEAATFEPVTLCGLQSSARGRLLRAPDSTSADFEMNGHPLQLAADVPAPPLDQIIDCQIVTECASGRTTIVGWAEAESMLSVSDSAWVTLRKPQDVELDYACLLAGHAGPALPLGVSGTLLIADSRPIATWQAEEEWSVDLKGLWSKTPTSWASARLQAAVLTKRPASILLSEALDVSRPARIEPE